MMMKPSSPLLAFAMMSAVAAAFAGELKLGQPLTLKESRSVTQILADPAPLVGKTVQVRGQVTEVCQMMGCWMALTEPGTSKLLRVKVNDGDIVFPKESVGKSAVAEGTLARIALTKEQAIAQAKHEAEEQGRKFNPASVKSGVVIYQIKGAGAVIEQQ